MAAQSEVQDYIEISDFSPGIYSSYQSRSDSSSNTEPSKDGAAQVNGTYGCIGLPGGGLSSLPRLESVQSASFILDPSLLHDPFIALLDILNLPGVHPPDFVTIAAAPAPEDHPIGTDYSGTSDYFLAIFQRYYNTQRQWSCYRQSLFLDPSLDGINNAYGAATPYPVINWGGSDMNPRIPFDYGFGCLDLGRENTADQTMPGQPHFKIGIGGRINSPSEDTGVSCRSVYVYPSSTDANSIALVVDKVGPSVVMSHQGRTVWVNVTPDVTEARSVQSVYEQYRGANWLVGGNLAAGLITSEELFWTKVNSITIDNPTGTVFVEENPVGIGTWCSMNANELFLVKHQGGAVAIQGSLNNPSVTRLPGVESTYGAVSHPTTTPMGCIYGTRTGVWAWNGSDTSVCISPQLDGFFWEPEGADRYHQAQVIGRFGYIHPYIFAPNNWVMDIRSGSWFRLENPNARSYAFYNVSFQDRVYASPLILPVVDEGGEVHVNYLFAYNLTVGRASWSWHSQPIQKTRNRRIDFRELSVVIQGVGTMTFTMTGLDGQVSVTEFVFDSADKPIAMTKPISFSGHDITVLIEANSGEANIQAPTLYRMSIGHRPAQSVTPTGSTK